MKPSGALMDFLIETSRLESFTDEGQSMPDEPRFHSDRPMIKKSTETIKKNSFRDFIEEIPKD